MLVGNWKTSRWWRTYRLRFGRRRGLARRLVPLVRSRRRAPRPAMRRASRARSRMGRRRTAVSAPPLVPTRLTATGTSSTRAPKSTESPGYPTHGGASSAQADPGDGDAGGDDQGLTGELRPGRGDGRKALVPGSADSAPRPRPSSAPGTSCPPFDFERRDCRSSRGPARRPPPTPSALERGSRFETTRRRGPRLCRARRPSAATPARFLV